jgi:hypothetical protein
MTDPHESLTSDPRGQSEGSSPTPTPYRPSFVYARNLQAGDAIELSDGIYTVLRKDMVSKTSLYVGLTLKSTQAYIGAYGGIYWFHKREKVLRTYKGPLS